MSKKEALNKLFTSWKKSHQNDKFPDLSKEVIRNCTLPDLKKSSRDAIEYSENFLHSFCPDGFLIECDKTKETILFICRESNIDDLVKNGVANPEVNDISYMYNCWKENNTKTNTNKYIKFIINNLSKLDKNKDDMNIAYMNLNKFGGFGSNNPSRLKNYVKTYKNHIIDEINIIDPSIIVCGGTGGHVEKLYGDKIHNIGFYKRYHPAYNFK